MIIQNSPINILSNYDKYVSENLSYYFELSLNSKTDIKRKNNYSSYTAYYIPIPSK